MAALLICTTCRHPIETTAGYLVATEDGLQFTNLADPQLAYGEEPIHFVCPSTGAEHRSRAMARTNEERGSTMLTIRERRGNDWATVKLVQAILTDDVRSTMIHGQTGQEISNGWLDAGSTVFVHPRDVGHTTHPYTDADELPDAHDVVYDAAGMKHRVRHADWDAIHIR